MYHYFATQDYLVLNITKDGAQVIYRGPEVKLIKEEDFVFFPKACLKVHETATEKVQCVKESDVMTFKRDIATKASV